VSEPAAYLAAVQRFATGPVADAAPGWSLGAAPDPALFAQATTLGLTGTRVPVELGGAGHGFATLVQSCEALAAVDFGFAMALVNTHNVGLRLCHSAPSSLRDRYLPRLLSGEICACTALTEPGTGSDFAAITTQAVQTAAGWQLSGEKTWIVNARRAGLAIVFAQCGTAGEAGSIAAFLVDLTQPGVRRYPIEAAFAQTSMGTGGFILDQVTVDADHLILPSGQAFNSILTEINAARTYVAAMCNAMLGAALHQVADYGATRQSFGKPLAQHQSWQSALDAATAALTRSRALTQDAIDLVTRNEDAQLGAAQAKITAVETGQKHLPELLHAMGAEGLRPQYCFTRHLAALQSAGLTDGATSLLRARGARLAHHNDSQSKR